MCTHVWGTVRSRGRWHAVGDAVGVVAAGWVGGRVGSQKGMGMRHSRSTISQVDTSDRVQFKRLAIQMVECRVRQEERACPPLPADRLIVIRNRRDRVPQTGWKATSFEAYSFVSARLLSRSLALPSFGINTEEPPLDSDGGGNGAMGIWGGEGHRCPRRVDTTTYRFRCGSDSHPTPSRVSIHETTPHFATSTCEL